MTCLENLPSVYQALIATTFTFLITMIGSLIVIFFKNIKKNILDIMLGISGGVMLAAAFFSLLNPSIEFSKNIGLIPWLVLFIGFIGGGILLFIGDKIMDKKLNNKNTSFKRILMLFSSITLHNIPEGMSIGVAFGSIKYGLDGATFITASLLALGIGIQNFPEGSAISLPLRREGMSRKKAFLIGSLSAIVEPISGVIGALLVTKVRILLPYLLSFAAGAMIYVVVSELIPESQTNDNKSLIALFTLIGFSIMMILDVGLS